jgi:K+-sensing histidine kinase KdpD
MFDKFETVKMHHANKSHAGLSLAYCKAVMDAHGGALSVANLTPRGVMYTLELA